VKLGWDWEQFKTLTKLPRLSYSFNFHWQTRQLNQILWYCVNVHKRRVCW